MVSNCCGYRPRCPAREMRVIEYSQRTANGLNSGLFTIRLASYALPRAQSSRAFSQALPNEHFCDPTLLGPEGRETYSAWLIERAAEWRDVYHNELLALNPIREMADWSGRCGCTRYIHLGAGSQILRIRWASNLGIRATTHDLVPGLIDRLGVRFQPASRMRTRLGYSHRCGHSTYNGQNGGL